MNGELLTEVRNKMKRAMKEDDKAMKMATRMVLGEVPRLNKKAGESPLDTEMVRIIKGLIKSERMTLEFSGVDTSEYLESLEGLLPEVVSEEDIRSYINTIDFTTLKNKMQAINLVKRYFGETSVDSAVVKKIITEEF